MPETALLQSHNLTELDGFETFQQGAVTDHMNTDGLQTNYAESTLAMPQYRILKAMVSAWVKEITHFNNQAADVQVNTRNTPTHYGVNPINSVATFDEVFDIDQHSVA